MADPIRLTPAQLDALRRLVEEIWGVGHVTGLGGVADLDCDPVLRDVWAAAATDILLGDDAARATWTVSGIWSVTLRFVDGGDCLDVDDDGRCRVDGVTLASDAGVTMTFRARGLAGVMTAGCEAAHLICGWRVAAGQTRWCREDERR